jgi:hypothetical protein
MTMSDWPWYTHAALIVFCTILGYAIERARGRYKDWRDQMKKRCYDCTEVCKSRVSLVLGSCGPDEYFVMNKDGNCPWYHRLWWKFWRPK